MNKKILSSISLKIISRIGLVFVFFVVILFMNQDVLLKKAHFFNDRPTFTIGEIKYLVTNEIVSDIEVGKKIANITKVTMIVSYLSEEDPYKKIGYIYEFKNQNSSKILIIEINDIYYKAVSIQVK